jgi:hypothetical protein
LFLHPIFQKPILGKEKPTNYLHQIFFHWNWKRLQKVPRKWKEISILFLIFPCNNFRLKVPTKGWIWIFKQIFNWFSNIAWASKLKSLQWFVNWRPRKSKETNKNIYNFPCFLMIFSLIGWILWRSNLWKSCGNFNSFWWVFWWVLLEGKWVIILRCFQGNFFHGLRRVRNKILRTFEWNKLRFIFLLLAKFINNEQLKKLGVWNVIQKPTISSISRNSEEVIQERET